MKLRVGLMLLMVSAAVFAREGAALRIIPTTGIPDGAIVTSFDILETDGMNQLVVELRDSDGVVSFYLFDYADGAVRGRLGGTEAVPVRFRDPPLALPLTRSTDGGNATGRYWPVMNETGAAVGNEYVTAVPLVERRFADVSRPEHAELPPREAGLEIDFVVTDTNTREVTRCALEWNLVRTSERMTVISARWILVQGRRHLLVGMAVEADTEPWPAFYRLYSESMELEFQTPRILTVDSGRSPQPVLADITGDGGEEVIVFSNSQEGPPLIIMQPVPPDPADRRMLALNGCSLRMNGPDVAALQRTLEDRGYGVGPAGVDGWYGPDTRAAVVSFQREAALPVTGVVDRDTWRAVGAE